MYEIEGVDEEMAREAFRLAHHKLPDRDQVVTPGGRRLSSEHDGSATPSCASASRRASSRARSSAGGGAVREAACSSYTNQLDEHASRSADTRREHRAGQDGPRGAQANGREAAAQEAAERRPRNEGDAKENRWPSADTTPRRCVGDVVSDKMQKTVVVEVDTPRPHRDVRQVHHPAGAATRRTTRRTSARSATLCAIVESRPLVARQALAGAGRSTKRRGIEHAATLARMRPAEGRTWSVE